MHSLQEGRLETDQAVADKGHKGRAEGEPPEGRLAAEFLKRLEKGCLAGRVGVWRIGIATRRFLDREP